MLFKKIIRRNSSDEFDAELENHYPKKQDIYRLYYINYHRIGEGYTTNKDNIGIIDWPFKPFLLPQKMSRKDGFKVLSYLIDYIERTFALKECSREGVALLDEALNLERLGFRRINIDVAKSIDDIADLFTVAGRVGLFKKSAHYPRYFEWYTENVTLEEVKAIYRKCDMEFYDLIPGSKQKDITESVKVKTYFK